MAARKIEWTRERLAQLQKGEKLLNYATMNLITVIAEIKQSADVMDDQPEADRLRSHLKAFYLEKDQLDLMITELDTNIDLLRKELNHMMAENGGE